MKFALITRSRLRGSACYPEEFLGKPMHNGVFLFYFSMIGLSSVVFDSKHRVLGHFFVGLSALFLFALVMTDFKLLGDLQIPASVNRIPF